MTSEQKILNARMRELLRAEAKLAALEAGGVDNWDNYDDSLVEYRAKNEVEEKRENLVQLLMEAVCEYIEEPAGTGCGFGIQEDGELALLHVLTTENVTFSCGENDGS